MGFFKKIFEKKALQNPEERFVATITEEWVRVEHPNRKREEIR